MIWAVRLQKHPTQTTSLVTIPSHDTLLTLDTDEKHLAKQPPKHYKDAVTIGVRQDTSPRPIKLVQFDPDLKSKLRNSYISLLKPLVVSTITFPLKADGSRDHYFHMSKAESNTTKTTRINKEIRSMTGHLPLDIDNAIFVRYDETNLDFLRAMVTGANGTPYAHGCYLFDIFMGEYPASPPKVNLITTGGDTVRFNPNLYANGYVCLSLLGTWSGQSCEVWNARSSITQVLMSIQSLVMNEDVYGNEPGYEDAGKTAEGMLLNEGYCNIVKWANIKYAMVEQIKKPSAGLERVTQVHFYLKKDIILTDVEFWVEQAKSTKAHYTGLVSSHNATLVTRFEDKNQYVKALKEVQVELIAALDDLKLKVEPSIPSENNSEENKTEGQETKAGMDTETTALDGCHSLDQPIQQEHTNGEDDNQNSITLVGNTNPQHDAQYVELNEKFITPVKDDKADKDLHYVKSSEQLTTSAEFKETTQDTEFIGSEDA